MQKIVLINGFDLEVSVKAFFHYRRLTGVDWAAYAYADEYEEYPAEYVRLDEDNLGRFAKYEPLYKIVSKDVGKYANWEDIEPHIVDEPFTRTDPALIETLETLKGEANGYTKLDIAEIPDDVTEWHIDWDMDSMTEWVVEGKRPPERRCWSGTPIEHL